MLDLAKVMRILDHAYDKLNAWPVSITFERKHEDSIDEIREAIRQTYGVKRAVLRFCRGPHVRQVQLGAERSVLRGTALVVGSNFWRALFELETCKAIWVEGTSDFPPWRPKRGRPRKPRNAPVKKTRFKHPNLHTPKPKTQPAPT